MCRCDNALVPGAPAETGRTCLACAPLQVGRYVVEPVIAARPMSSATSSLTGLPMIDSSAAVARLGVEPKPNSPMTRRDTRSCSSTCMATNVSAIAKSP
jgi:hypothetical protein